jgi:hypothetical protein
MILGMALPSPFVLPEIGNFSEHSGEKNKESASNLHESRNFMRETV